MLALTLSVQLLTSRFHCFQSDVTDALLHVEGPHRLWQHSLEQFYYTLRLTGSSQLDSLLHDDELEEAKKEGEFV